VASRRYSVGIDNTKAQLRHYFKNTTREKSVTRTNCANLLSIRSHVAPSVRINVSNGMPTLPIIPNNLHFSIQALQPYTVTGGDNTRRPGSISSDGDCRTTIDGVYASGYSINPT